MGENKQCWDVEEIVRRAFQNKEQTQRDTGKLASWNSRFTYKNFETE